MPAHEGQDPDLEEWDLLVGLVLAQLTTARREQGDDEWLSTSTLARAVRELGRGGAIAVLEGWARDAERRGVVERRVRGGREEIRVGADPPAPLATQQPRRRHFLRRRR
jgi:hypothetical protein